MRRDECEEGVWEGVSVRKGECEEGEREEGEGEEGEGEEGECEEGCMSVLKQE